MKHYYIHANIDKENDVVEVSALTISGDKQVPLAKVKEALADYAFIEYRLNHLAGKLLTQCDASFNDPVQRKAVKDLVRTFIADEFGFFADHMQKGLIEHSLKDIEKMSDAEFLQWQKDNPPVGIDQVIAPGK